MALKKYNPVTPSQRELIQVDKDKLWKGKPYRPLTRGKISTGGRNNKGRITSWHRGGGHKKLYRFIDFKRSLKGEAIVEHLEYDPNRTAFVALLSHINGDKSYILAPNELKVGDKIVSGVNEDIKIGNCLMLKNIPVGTIIHNVEMKPGKGGQLARSAGTFVSLVGKDSGYAQLKLSSGELRLVPLDCRATIGMVSNLDQKNINIGKAGRSRWIGRRPHVRGVAMNPIDHPHGGGEGKTSGGRHPVTPWGKKTKGKKTRKNKLTSKLILKRKTK